MLGFGTGEMLVIAVVALLVIGPDRLPTVMRQLGRWYGQVRRTADELRRAFVLEADRQDAAERYKQLQERRRKAQEEARRRVEHLDTAAQPEPVATPTEGATEGAAEGPAANDIPPDAPHPSLQSPPDHTAQELSSHAPPPEH